MLPVHQLGNGWDGKQKLVGKMICSPSITLLIGKVVVSLLCLGFLASFKKW